MSKDFQINIREESVGAVTEVLWVVNLIQSGCLYCHRFFMAFDKEVTESKHPSPKAPVQLLSPRQNQGVIISKSRSPVSWGILCAKVRSKAHHGRAMKATSHEQAFSVCVHLVVTCLVTADPVLSL